MTEKEKKLYESIKSKTRQQIKRRLAKFFTSKVESFKFKSKAEQTKWGDFYMVLEMEIKKEVL